MEELIAVAILVIILYGWSKYDDCGHDDDNIRLT